MFLARLTTPILHVYCIFVHCVYSQHCAVVVTCYSKDLIQHSHVRISFSLYGLNSNLDKGNHESRL